VELSCHGNDYILQQIVLAFTASGARMAKPGEFTLRAFLNGKIDLAQAEAVADVIAGQSAAAHKAALHQLRGGFSNDLMAMREQLIKFSALLELELDFSQEDVEFADRTQFYALIGQITAATAALAASFKLGNVIKNGVSVAIVGKPNAGKSTLLNALLNEERAIVSDIAGTTRDTIEETLNIEGILFRLIDTAGIRSHTADSIEEQGIARSRQAMTSADIIVYLYDVATTEVTQLADIEEELKQHNKPYVLVGNKADLLAQRVPLSEHTLLISAKEKQQISALKTRLYALVAGGEAQPEGTIVTNARHFAALQDCLSSLKDIKEGLDRQLPADLLTLDIRHCLHHLGTITGQITTEDKLDYIFSKFCIGK
jgi:tRNA modification GTPase